VYTLLCFFRFNNRAVVLFKRGGHERAQMKRKTHSNSTLLRCKLTGVVLLGTGLSTVRIGLARTVYIYTVYDCRVGDFPAKNTVYTPFIFMVLANPVYT
jgi:hypothetical protein